MNWVKNENVESFMMSERTASDITDQYFKVDAKYFVKSDRINRYRTNISTIGGTDI